MKRNYLPSLLASRLEASGFGFDAVHECNQKFGKAEQQSRVGMATMSIRGSEAFQGVRTLTHRWISLPYSARTLDSGSESTRSTIPVDGEVARARYGVSFRSSPDVLSSRSISLFHPWTLNRVSLVRP